MRDDHGVRDPRLLVVLLIGTGLRFYQLGHESLWTDELLTLEFVTRWSGVDLLVNLPQAQPHLPVYYLLLDAWVAVAGTSETALRAPSAVFGILAILAMYSVGARLLGHEAGLLAAVLLAVSPFHIRFSQEVRMYSLLVLLTLVSVYGLLRVRDQTSRWTIAGFAVSTILLVYTHVFAVFVVAAEALYVAVRVLRSERGELRTWAGAFTPVAVALVPFAVAAVLILGDSDGVSLSYVPLPTLPRVLKMVSTYVGYGFGTTNLVHAAVIPALLGLAVLGGLRYRLDGVSITAPVQSLRGAGLDISLSSTDETVLLGALFLVPFGLPIVLSYLVTPIFWPRYTIAASVGLFLLVARGLTHLEHRHLRYAVAGLLVVSMVPSLGIYYTGDQKEQWREVGATIDKQAESGDLVLVADQITERGVHRYVDRTDVRIKGIVVEDSGTGYAPANNSTVRTMQRDEGRVWLVFSHASDAERARIRAIVAENRTQTFHRQYEGVEVYRYVPEDRQ